MIRRSLMKTCTRGVPRKGRDHIHSIIASRKMGGSLTVPSDVKIVEVGPRDGLQNETSIVTVADKVSLIKRLIDAGCSNIETGSFVSPSWVPNMANSGAVMEELKGVKCSKSLVFSCLVPNLQGFQMAVDANADEIAIFGSASESFSQKNINCSIDESLQRFKSVTEEAKKHGIPVRGYLSCVLACPYEGRVAPSDVAKVVEKMLDLGCYELSLGDTLGVGTPASTVEMLAAVESVVGMETQLLAVHFHDTYGQALSNILVSLDQGISSVDSSVAGLGGCPFAKGASGNVASEDVVYMLDGLGVKTGIQLEKLVDAGEFICSVLGIVSRSRAGLAIATKRSR